MKGLIIESLGQSWIDKKKVQVGIGDMGILLAVPGVPKYILWSEPSFKIIAYLPTLEYWSKTECKLPNGLTGVFWVTTFSLQPVLKL